jgi:hypothetical protein
MRLVVGVDDHPFAIHRHRRIIDVGELVLPAEVNAIETYE